MALQPDPLWFFTDAAFQQRHPLTFGQFLPDWDKLDADEQRRRVVRMHRAWEAYRGNFPPPLKVKPGDPDDNVIANKAATIADKHVAFLFGQEVTFQVDDGADTPREQHIADVWRFNRKMPTLQKLGLNGAVCGHAFLRIYEADAARRPFPRLVVLNPEDVSVRWEDADIDDVWQFRVGWISHDRATGRQQAFRETIERKTDSAWTIVKEKADPSGVRWEAVGPTRAWAYPFAPIAHCQNLPVPNEFWGMSDLEDDIIRMMLAYNFALSNNQKLVRYYAHPRMWGVGFNATQIEMGPGGILQLDGPDAKMDAVDSHGDIMGSLEHIRRLSETIHERGRVPEITTGRVDNLGPVSGVALKVMYGPALDEARVKQFTYGGMLDDVNWRLLVLKGDGSDRDARPTTIWPEVAPIDPLEERQTLIADLQLGASHKSVLTKAGYDADEELKQRREEDEAAAELAAESAGQMAAASGKLPAEVTPRTLPKTGVKPLTTNRRRDDDR